MPKTPTGRWAGVTIMITGIAVLGLLSGSLASFFRLRPDEDGSQHAGSDGSPESPEPGIVASPVDVPSTPLEAALGALTAELAALRRQVEALSDRVPGSDAGRQSG